MHRNLKTTKVVQYEVEPPALPPTTPRIVRKRLTPKFLTTTTPKQQPNFHSKSSVATTPVAVLSLRRKSDAGTYTPPDDTDTTPRPAKKPVATFEQLREFFFNKADDARSKQLENRFWEPSGDLQERAPVEVLSLNNSWLYGENEDAVSQDIKSLMDEIDSLLPEELVTFATSLAENIQDEPDVEKLVISCLGDFVDEEEENIAQPSVSKDTENLVRAALPSFKLHKRIPANGKLAEKYESLRQIREEVLPKAINDSLVLIERTLASELFDLKNADGLEPLTDIPGIGENCVYTSSLDEETAKMFIDLEDSTKVESKQAQRRSLRLEKLLNLQKTDCPFKHKQYLTRYVVAEGSSSVVYEAVDCQQMRKVLVWVFSSKINIRQFSANIGQLPKIREAVPPLEITVDPPAVIDISGSSNSVTLAAKVLSQAFNSRSTLSLANALVIPEAVFAADNEHEVMVTNWARGRSLYHHVREFGKIERSTTLLIANQIARLIDEWLELVYYKQDLYNNSSPPYVLPITSKRVLVRERQIFIAAGWTLFYYRGAMLSHDVVDTLKSHLVADQINNELQERLTHKEDALQVYGQALVGIIKEITNDDLLLRAAETWSPIESKTVLEAIESRFGKDEGDSTGISIDCDVSVFHLR